LYDNHHHKNSNNNSSNHSHEAQGRPSLSSRPVQDQSYNHQASVSSTNSTPASWSDTNWRSIFDAALVKAQQAVQLDELKETTLAANLYAQAANDLGRVIPMCGSEKKKQSMLAIVSLFCVFVFMCECVPVYFLFCACAINSMRYLNLCLFRFLHTFASLPI